MTVETRAPVTDLTESLARAAVAAIADTVPTIQADPKAVRYLTVEIEVAGGKHRVQRVPRSNGALLVLGRCATCNGSLGDGRRDRGYCSAACRQRAYRARRRGA